MSTRPRRYEILPLTSSLTLDVAEREISPSLPVHRNGCDCHAHGHAGHIWRELRDADASIISASTLLKCAAWQTTCHYWISKSVHAQFKAVLPSHSMGRRLAVARCACTRMPWHLRMRPSANTKAMKPAPMHVAADTRAMCLCACIEGATVSRLANGSLRWSNVGRRLLCSCSSSQEGSNLGMGGRENSKLRTRGNSGSCSCSVDPCMIQSHRGSTFPVTGIGRRNSRSSCDPRCRESAPRQ